MAYNRRYLNERLPVDMYNSISNKTFLSIIMLDCDEFKSINSNLEHLGGDQALRNLINIIKQMIRENNDWVARYGGDEFLISLPNTDRQNEIKIAERIRKMVENTLVEYNGVNSSMTISV